MSERWQIKPEWQGETAFIVASGPSVKSVDLELLRGRRVIAVNSSFEAVPFADIAIFGDARWWEVNRAKFEHFKGRICCGSQSPRDVKLLRVRRKPPPPSSEADVLVLQFTTSTAAMDLAAKLGAKRIVILGMDGKNSDNGTTHHHRPHPWRQVSGWEARHRRDIQSMQAPLRELGIEVVLATPSAYSDLWPVVPLEKLIEQIDAPRSDADSGDAWHGGQPSPASSAAQAVAQV
jgi:hypothetical protein